MKVGVTIRGDTELKRKLREMPDAANRGLARGLVKAALRVQNRARRLVQQGPKSGVVYRRRGVRHQASAPGEPPATDTGNLVQNIIADPQAAPDPEGGISIRVVARTIYAFWLQFGTTRMKPRPWMDVALHDEMDACIQDVRTEVKKELDDARS